MSASTAPAQPSLIQVAVWVLYRYRLWLAMWCAFAAVLGFLASRKLGKETWRIQATLTYVPRGVHDGQRMVYQPPNHPTMAEFLRSMEYLDAAAEKSQIPMPTGLLANILEVQLPPNSELLQIYLNWANADDAIKFLDALMQVAIEKRQQVRNHIIEEAETSSREELRKAQAKLDNLERVYRQQFPSEPGMSLPLELAKVTSNITTTEALLGTVRSNIDKNKLRLKQFEDEFAPLLGKSDGVPDDPQALARNEMRLQKLRQGSLDDAEIARLEVELKTARADLATNRTLARSGAVSRIELTRSENAVDILDMQLRRAKERREQLNELEKVFKNQSNSPAARMSLIEQEYRVKKWELQTDKLSLAEELKVQEAQLNRLRQTRDELLARIKISEPLQKQIDGAKLTVEQLRNFTSNLTAQMHPDQRELSVGTEASAGWSPFATSYRKWTIAVFLMLVGGFVAGLIAWEMFKIYRGVEGLALRLGLPILARFGPMPLRDGPELAARLMETRRLALRLCQAVPEPGSVVLLASPMRGSQIDHFAAELSRCLTGHEERILVVDMRINGRNQTATGIVQQLPTDSSLPVRMSPPTLLELDTYTHSAASLVRPTQMNAVDYLPIGSPDRLAGVVAMTRVRQAVNEMKERYTLVFMIAPPLTGDIDTEILGAFAQGVLLITDEKPNTSIVTRTVTGLRSAQVPIIGAVVYPADEPQIPALVVAH